VFPLPDTGGSVFLGTRAGTGDQELGGQWAATGAEFGPGRVPDRMGFAQGQELAAIARLVSISVQIAALLAPPVKL
jgi:hypothetical protein